MPIRLLGAFFVLMITAIATLAWREPVPPAPTVIEQDVLATLSGWATAWAARDASTYLHYYSPDFEIPDTLTRPQWEETRRQKLKNASHVRIEAVDVVLEVGSPVAVVVTFQQRYHSDQLTEISNKMLVFIRENEHSNAWKIAAERTSY